MSRRPHSYSRWPIELPSILLVGLWLGLWFAWPRVNQPPARTREPTVTRIRYIDGPGAVMPRREELLGFLFQPRERELIVEDPVPLVAAPMLTANPHILAYRAGTRRPAADEPEPPALARDAAAGLRVYRASWPLLTPFGSGPFYSLRVEAKLSPTLSACGYTLPTAALDALNDGDKAWEFTYYVVCDSEGRTRDVFSLAEPVVSILQSNVVSVLNQGRGQPGHPCEGRVVVRRVYIPVSAAPSAPVGKEQTWPSES